SRLYPSRRLSPIEYIDRRFARTRRRLEAERRRSFVFRRLEWIVAEVKERLGSDGPREEIAQALPQDGSGSRPGARKRSAGRPTAPTTSEGSTTRPRKRSTAATTCALGAPKPTSVPIIPSSTTPIPPGVRGSELITRPSAQARNASLSGMVADEIPTA